MKLSRLTDPLWWKSAAIRALYTAIAIALPYIGGSLLTEIPWISVVSAALLGAIASLATSLAGLPEADGVDLPWWLAAVERTVKTFGQALAAGLVGPVLLTDVDWMFVLQAAAIAALVSLFRLILATLPVDPTALRPVAITVNNPIPFASAETVPAESPATATRSGSQGEYLHFEIPRGMPGVNAKSADEIMADFDRRTRGRGAESGDSAG